MAAVTDRFFEAYADLIESKRVSVRQFCRDIDVDRRNFQRLLKEGKLRIRAEWLSVLVEKYGVSPRWLLTGDGWIFGE